VHGGFFLAHIVMARQKRVPGGRRQGNAALRWFCLVCIYTLDTAPYSVYKYS
jgi:hypothetical protein